MIWNKKPFAWAIIEEFPESFPFVIPTKRLKFLNKLKTSLVNQSGELELLLFLFNKDKIIYTKTITENILEDQFIHLWPTQGK